MSLSEDEGDRVKYQIIAGSSSFFEIKWSISSVTSLFVAKVYFPYKKSYTDEKNFVLEKWVKN